MPAASALGTRDIRGMFYEELDRAAEASWVRQVAFAAPSDQETENYKWAWSPPAIREMAGARQPKGLGVSSLALTNVTYEATVEVDVDDLRRDKTGQTRMRIGELADCAVSHWEDLLTTLIANGESGTAYDGQGFFDTDHSTGASGAQYNLLTASEVSQLNVGTATAPSEAEMALAILNVIGYMMSYKNEQGQAKVNDRGRGFAVLVPFNLWGPASAAVANERLNASSGQVSNPIRNAGLNISVAMLPGLASAASAVFYVARTDARSKPFIIQEEVPLTFDELAEGSEEEFKNNRHLYGIKGSRAAGYGMWFLITKNTLS